MSIEGRTGERTVEQTTGLTIVLLLVAVAVLIQAGTMIAIWSGLRKMSGRVEAARDNFKQKFDPRVQSVTEILTNAREPLRAITTNLAEISKMLRERTGDADRMVARLVDKSRTQFIRTDRMVSDLAQEVETTSDAVQRGVLAPIQEVSAITKGMQAGLEFVFSRRRTTSVSEAAQDEQCVAAQF
jgi:ABC-type transporter Mla subunit MlaD